MKLRESLTRSLNWKKTNEKLQLECAKQTEEVGRLREVLLRRKKKMCNAFY